MKAKYVCTEDFIMNTGERAFTKGHVYPFKYDNNGEWLTIDDQGDSHWMKFDDLETFVRIIHEPEQN